MLDVRLAGFVGIGIVKAADIPALGRDFSNGVDTTAEQLPKRLWI